MQATAKEHDAHLRRAREALEDERRQLTAQKAQLAKRQAVVRAPRAPQDRLNAANSNVMSYCCLLLQHSITSWVVQLV